MNHLYIAIFRLDKIRFVYVTNSKPIVYVKEVPIELKGESDTQVVIDYDV